MNEYLSFRKMITPTVIQILFWIGVGVCVLTGIAMIAIGAASDFGGGAQVLGGLLMLILGPVFVRVQCELILVVFNILDVLKDIRGGKTDEGITVAPVEPAATVAPAAPTAPTPPVEPPAAPSDTSPPANA